MSRPYGDAGGWLIVSTNFSAQENALEVLGIGKPWVGEWSLSIAQFRC